MFGWLPFKSRKNELKPLTRDELDEEAFIDLLLKRLDGLLEPEEEAQFCDLLANEPQAPKVMAEFAMMHVQLHSILGQADTPSPTATAPLVQNP